VDIAIHESEQIRSMTFSTLPQKPCVTISVEVGNRSDRIDIVADLRGESAAHETQLSSFSNILAYADHVVHDVLQDLWRKIKESHRSYFVNPQDALCPKIGVAAEY